MTSFLLTCGCSSDPSDTSQNSEKDTESETLSTETSSETVIETETEKGDDNVPRENPVLYQIAPDKNMLLNCYVIKTATGKLIVIDGGGAGSDINSGYLYKKLQEISGEKEPVIEAWFLSHMHDDHVKEFTLIGTNKRKKMTVNNVYFNFPSREFMNTSEGGKYAFLYDELEQSYDRFMGKGEFAKTNAKTAFEGDVIDIDGIKFEILMTVTDEEKETNINDTSMIFRVTIEGQTILFLGDAYLFQSQRLIDKYGDDLKSDMVQMAHHGQNGVSKEAYEKIAPTLCLWPIPIWVYQNAQGVYQTTEVRNWMAAMGVKYHLVAGVDLTQSLTFPVDFSTLEEFDIEPK